MKKGKKGEKNRLTKEGRAVDRKYMGEVLGVCQHYITEGEFIQHKEA